MPGCLLRVVHGDVRAGLDDPLVAGRPDDAGRKQLGPDQTADKLGKLLFRAARLPLLLEPKRGDAKHFGCGRLDRCRSQTPGTVGKRSTGEIRGGVSLAGVHHLAEKRHLAAYMGEHFLPRRLDLVPHTGSFLRHRPSLS